MYEINAVLEENMKKLYASLFALLFTVLMLVPVQVYAESDPVRNKRIVSVMYDDSGSMEGDRWVNANYAMQAFAAMLNKEDTLYISYMSENESDNKSECTTKLVDLNNVQTEVDNIRNHSSEGRTPVAALQNSFDALLNENDANPNTEYWLVAFTDGDFNEEDTPQITSKLKSYAETDMANGSKAKVFFMTIGDTENKFTPSDSQKNNIDIRRALTSSDVTDNIFSVAAEISGRYQIAVNDIEMPNKKTIIVSADLPLFNIEILTQNSDIIVNSITFSDENSIPIKSNVAIKAPEKTIPAVSEASDSALGMKGYVAIAGYDEKILPAGKYTINFSDNLSEKDVAVLLEPAIELRVTILKDGVPVDDNYVFNENETGLSVKASLYEYGSDNEVLPSMMPEGVSFSIVHTENDNVIDSSDSLSLDSMTITTGDNSVTASAALPGFFNLSTTKTFSPQKPIVGKIDAEIYPDGSERLSDSDGPEVVYLTNLENNKTGIKFTLYEDEGKIDASRARQLLDSFNNGLSADFNNHKTEILPDGSYLVYPTKESFLYNPLFDWIFHHGTQKISIDLNGAHAEESLTFKLGPGWLIPLLWIVIPIYLIWWLLLKKHFPRRTLIHLYGRKDMYDNTIYYKEDDSLRLSWFGASKRKNILLILPKLLYLLLPTPSKVRFHGYTFTGQKTFIRRNEEQLVVKNVSGKSVSTASRNPSGKYPDSKTDFDTTLYIKDSSGNTTQYSCFKLE